MLRVLIVGKKSFIGSNLYTFLKKKYYVKKISYNDVKKKNTNFFKNYSHIINCSVNPNYIKLRYNPKFDYDLKIEVIIRLHILLPHNDRGNIYNYINNSFPTIFCFYNY